MPRLLNFLRVRAASKSAITFALLIAAAICAIYLFRTRLAKAEKQVLAPKKEENTHESPVASVPPDSRLARLRLPAVCTNESCRADYAKHLHEKDTYPIPAIRHILWRNELVSQYFAEQLRSWQKIHPDWTFVLWRDRDLEPFVETYFPGLLYKFKSLPEQIMRADMVRFMLLYQFGGTYADLDYTLVRSLDTFRRFHAVITREPEAHSFHYYGLSWPIKLMASPAFMMSAPRHSFNFCVLEKLRDQNIDSILGFAGPVGLTSFIEDYNNMFPVATNALETIYVPPSNSFYPYPDNGLAKIHKLYRDFRIPALNKTCIKYLGTSLKKQPSLIEYCKDVSNFDPITDKSQPVFAIHDLNKPSPSYAGGDIQFYYKKLIDARLVIPNLKLGLDFISTG